MNSVGDVEAGSSKPWDQPLSTEDMRNRASNWSLADDSQLLAYLECVSRNITSRSYEIQKELDSLIHETRVSGVKVNNVINDFNHLSSLQFIENRVYDEEAKEPEKAQSEAQAESKEQQEAELVRRMRDAFQHGVQVVRSSLEFVDLHQEGDSDEDSEDEGAPSAEPLFRSRDPYLHRALPLLIGSQAFVQDDKVGLGDLLSEDEEEEEEKSSRGEYESDRSESDFDEEKEAKAPADTRMAQAMLREYGNHVESSEEELFDQKAELHSASSESEPDSDGDLLPSEPPPKRGSVSSRRSEGAGSVRRREEDLFGVPSDGEMFAEAEEQSPFKKRGGAFSSPRKLFDDDEEDEKGDLFSDVPPTKERAPSTTTRPTPQFTQSGKKLPAGARSMLGGSGPPPLMRSESKPSEVKENAVRAQAAAVPKLPPRASSTDEEVFSDHSDEENGLFKDAPKVVQRQQSEREERPAPSSSGLFDTQASKAVPAPAKPAHKTFSAGGLFDEEEEDDLWAPVKKEPSSLHNSVKTETSAKEPPPPVKDEETLQVTQVSKPGGLFEDDDDLLFVPDRDSQKVQTKPETKLAKSFLFDDSEDIFSSAVPAPGGPGIAEPRPSSSEGGTSEGAEAEPFLAKGRAASRGLFLFEDDVPAEEVQTKEEPEPVPAATRKPTRESISLFDEEEADEDLFADRTPPTHMADSQSSHSIQSSSWSTGSKGDAEPASVRGEAASEQVGKARSGSRFLFEREDELFGGVADEDVDLFAPTESGQPTTDSSSQKKPVGGVSLFGGSTLFGDELKHRLGRVGGVLEEPEADILDDGSGDLFAAKPRARPPPLRDTKVVSVSFDEPADQIKTLTSATKDRARIQTKRRPPSRKGRQPRSSDDAPSSDSGGSPATAVLRSPPTPARSAAMASATDAVPPTAEEGKPPAVYGSSSTLASMVKSPSTEEEDLFSVVENSLRPVPEARRPGPSLAPPARPQEVHGAQAPWKGILDDSDEDLFSSLNHAGKTAPSRPRSLQEGSRGSDALFGFGDGDIKASQSTKKAATMSFLHDSDEDATALPKDSPKKEAPGVLDDDDADIFTSSSRALSSRPKRSTLFDDDDSDDIFGTRPVVPRASTAEKKSVPPVKKSVPKVPDFKDPLLSELDN